MRFVKRNIKSQNTNSSTSTNNTSIVGNSTNSTNSTSGNYIHPTGTLWGNKYTGKETLNGNLTSEGTIKGDKIEGTEITATNINGDVVTGKTINGNIGNFEKANVTDTLSANQAIIDNASIKQLYISGSAHFVELIIDKINSTQGSIILSAAHAELSRVEAEANNIVKCYFMATDGDKKITNDFATDDLVICESFNVSEGYNKDISNKFIWKRVLETGTTEDGSEHWFSVYATEYNNLDYMSYLTNSEFEMGDVVCSLGNYTNSERQDAIMLTATNPNFVEIGHAESTKTEYVFKYPFTKSSELTDISAPSKMSNIITNGDFKSGSDNWTLTNMSIAPSGHNPILNADSTACLYYPYFAQNRTSGKITNAAISQNIGTLTPGIYTLVFNALSLYVGSGQTVSYMSNFKVGLKNTDGTVDLYKTMIPKSSSTETDYFDNSTHRVQKYKMFIKVGYPEVDTTPLVLDRYDTDEGNDAVFELDETQNNDLTISLSVENGGNWFAISNVVLYKTDAYIGDIDTKAAKVTHNVITEKIEAPAIISFDGINRFSLADKHVSVFSPSYNLISAGSVSGLSEIITQAITDGTLSKEQINDIIDGKFGSLDYISSTNFEQTLLSCTDYTQTKESITLKADSVTVKNISDSLGNVTQRVTTCESSIKTNAENIELKVSKTDFNELGERVSTNESTISQMPDQISLSVKNDFKTTGLDITDGHVIIDADNTTINGNLELYAKNDSDALSLFDSDSVERTTITSQEIGGLDEQSIDASNTYNAAITKKNGESTIFDLGTKYYSAGTVVTAGTKWGDRVIYYGGLYKENNTGEWKPRYITSPNKCKITLKLVNQSNSSTVYTVPCTQKTYSADTYVLEATINTSQKSVTVSTAGTYIIRVEITWANSKSTCPYTDGNDTMMQVFAYMTSDSPSKTLVGADGLYATNGTDKYLYYGTDGLAAADAQYTSADIMTSMSSVGAMSAAMNTETGEPDDKYLYFPQLTGASHVATFKNGGNQWTNSQCFGNIQWMINLASYQSSSTPYKPYPSTDIVMFNDTTKTAYYLDLTELEYNGHVVEIRCWNKNLQLKCSSGAKFKALSGTSVTSSNLYSTGFYDVKMVFWNISSSGSDASSTYNGLWVILSQSA